MCTLTVPGNAGEALGMLESAMGFLADLDSADMPAEALAECLRGLERTDAVEAAARGRFLAAFDANDGHLGDGQHDPHLAGAHHPGDPRPGRRAQGGTGPGL